MVALGLALSRVAAADPDALLRDARAAERAGDHAAEHAACTQLLAQGATGRPAEVCEKRLGWLEVRRDTDGSFASLTELQAVRRSRRTLAPEEARARVAALTSAETAPETVRDEASIWLAREALTDRGDAEDALRWTTPLWDRLRDAPDSATRSAAADLHSRALLASGDEDAALTVESEAKPLRSAVPREGLPLAMSKQRRGRLRVVSWAVLAAFAGVAGPLAGLAFRRGPRPRPRGLLPLTFACLGAAGLAAAWDPTTLPAFGVLLAALAAVHTVAAGALAHRRHPVLTAALRGLTALATLGAAYLVLGHFQLLDGVGL